MTRKHYKAIADVIVHCTTSKGNIDKDSFVALLSAELYKDNPLFCNTKFYDACYKSKDKQKDKQQE